MLDAVNKSIEFDQAITRILPAETTDEFVPNKWQTVVGEKESINRQACECALLLKLRDEIKVGNLAISECKRFGNFDDFFVDATRWQAHTSEFFRHLGSRNRPRS